MDTPKAAEKNAAETFEIDYDHVNVAELMEKIRKAAAEAPPSPPAGDAPETGSPRSAASPGESRADFGPTGPPLVSRPSPPAVEDTASQPSGLKQKVKKIVRKLMRPFFPIIRLLGFPIHEELRAAIKSLHETNKRLDYLDRLLSFTEEKFDRSLQMLEQRFEQRIERRQDDLEREFRDRGEVADRRMEKGELRLDTLEGRQKDLDRSMVYIQLLHGLSHNLVVELTKLKIESDTLKTKFRILEKDQEILRSREKAVERQVLK